MRYLIATVVSLLALPAFAKFQLVTEENRAETVEMITHAIGEHYQTLSTNEQWGVGMGCTLGGMIKQVKDAEKIYVDSEQGLIFAQTGQKPHLFNGPTRYDILMEFSPENQTINKVTIVALPLKGGKKTCSTRAGLF